MHNNYNAALYSLLFLFTLLLLSACEQGQYFGQERYSVLFDGDPKLSKTENEITYKGQKIGNVLGAELSNNGKFVAITIGIDSKYVQMMTTHTVFYPKDGKLVYAQLSEGGSLLSPGEYLYGFSGQTTYNLTRTGALIGSTSLEVTNWLLEKTGNLLEAFK